MVHAALLAAAVAFLGRPREAAPVTLERAGSAPEIGVITLVEPSAPIAKSTAPGLLPPVAVAVVRPVQPPSPPPGPVREVAHRETPKVPTWMPAAPTIQPVEAIAGGPGSVGTPGAAAPGSPSSRPLPAGAVTEFFGVPAVGKSVVFVLDRSASMGLDGRLDRARRELALSLRRLPATARFQVVAYNRTAEPVRLPDTAGLLPATPAAVDAVIAAVGKLPAEGSTDHAAALTAALALTPDVIYFLTDEDDLELRDVQAITRRNHGRTCIHALCLTAATGEAPMLLLARQNRGQFRIAEQ